MIAAIGEKRELGKGNALLFHIPEDMKHFKTITSGHPVIMGRKTFQSIGRPLPGRTNIVVSRNAGFKADGCIAVKSLGEAVSRATEIDRQEIFIIGGGQIYAQGIAYADKLYLTVVRGVFDADTYFPDYSQFNNVISTKEGNNGTYSYTFLELGKL